MIKPELPKNEQERQQAVDKYNLLDTLPEESYDNITALMAYICDVPISLVTLLDKERNFLKSHHGVPFNESPRDISFCGHAINSDELITIIEDSREDERFHGNPLVTDYQTIFYAGATLINSDGYKLGTLCVYDTKPRKLSDKQKNALLVMAKQVTNLFEQRYQNIQLLELQDKLKNRNEDLKKFTRVISHDLKSPLANIISLSQLLEDENKGNLSKDSLQYIEYLKSSSYSLNGYIDGLLNYYKSETLIENRSEEMVVQDMFSELKKITDPDQSVNFKLTTSIHLVVTNKSALLQILVNLVTNSIKYNKKPNTQIEIDISDDETHYIFSVIDNGDGIPKGFLDKIFTLFSVVGTPDKFGNLGTGIGLSSVKNIVKNLGGTITVASELGTGSTFTFSIQK